jgi:PAS domain S-box-containing protein
MTKNSKITIIITINIIYLIFLILFYKYLKNTILIFSFIPILLSSYLLSSKLAIFTQIFYFFTGLAICLHLKHIHFSNNCSIYLNKNLFIGITANLLLLFSLNYIKKIIQENQKKSKIIIKLNQKLKKYYTIIQQSPVSILITNPQAKIEYINDAFCKISGYSKDELIGKNPRILKSGKTPRHTYTSLWNTISNGKTWKGIFYNKKQNGQIYIEEEIIFPILNNKNKIINYIGIKKDITEKIEKEKLLNDQLEELKNLSEELRLTNEELLKYKDQLEKQNKIIFEKEKRLNTIIQSIGEGVAIGDFNENITFANKAACKIFEVDSLINRNLLDFLPKDEIKKIKEQTINRLNGKSNNYTLKINTAKGKTKDLIVTATTDFNKEKKPTGTIAVFRDITQMLEYEKTLYNKNIIINKQYQEIKDSIEYAKNLQQALLTPINLIKKYLNNFFLIYLPKDIVSGDFYYINKINNKIIIALGDCTGHGVAGAFMSIIGITYIHDTVRLENNINPAKILEILRQRIKRTFRTFGSEFMASIDLALCTINTDNNLLQYSGAFSPVFLIRDSELIELKPQRNPIGFYYSETNFKNTNIPIKKNDTFYLFSDGYRDQFDYINNKKYTKKRFKNKILEISNLTLENQKAELISELKNWKGNNEQTDDISIFAFKY